MSSYQDMVNSHLYSIPKSAPLIGSTTPQLAPKMPPVCAVKMLLLPALPLLTPALPVTPVLPRPPVLLGGARPFPSEHERPEPNA